MARGVPDRAHLARYQWTMVLGKRTDAGDIPQQERGMFERVLFRQLDAVHAAVNRAVLGDGRYRGIHHRQIGIETPEAARLRRGRAPLLEKADVLRPIAMA